MNTIITYDINNLTSVSIFDGTTFEEPESVLDIRGVRILFSTVNSVNEIRHETVCLPWYEYVITSGTAVANGVSYPTNSVMIFANETTPTGTFTMENTGWYSQYVSDILPLDGSGWSFTPTQTGREAQPNTGCFYDEIFTINYEFYDEVFNAGDTLDAGTYLVVAADTTSMVVIGGTKGLYVGETYVSLGSETFTATNDGYLVKFNDSTSFSFATLYQSYLVYQDYLRIKSTAVAPNWDLDSDLLAVGALLASPMVACDTDSGIDLTGLQLNIDRILSYYTAQLQENV
jgi:hypothetical protein